MTHAFQVKAKSPFCKYTFLSMSRILELSLWDLIGLCSSCWETSPHDVKPTNSCIVFLAASLWCFPDRARDGCSFLSTLVMMNARLNQDFIQGFRGGTISIFFFSGTFSFVLRGYNIPFLYSSGFIFTFAFTEEYYPVQGLARGLRITLSGS